MRQAAFNSVSRGHAKPAKIPAPRLKIPSESELSPKQQELLADIQKTRGKGPLGGPFAVLLHAPEYGDLAQKLGAFCRYQTTVPPHLSEFTILVLARFWRSQYEFWVHAPIAEKAGVKAATIEALRTGRVPKLTKEQRAIYDFIAELHKHQARIATRLTRACMRFSATPARSSSSASSAITRWSR